MNAESHSIQIVGIDVGGTKVAGGLVSFPQGSLAAKITFPTRPERGGEALLIDVANLAAQLLERAQSSATPVSGIGVGICELVDVQGTVMSAATVPWKGCALREKLEQLAPTTVEADVRAGALAEAIFGAGKPFHSFVYLTVGTGISHTLVCGAQAYTGARGNALIAASGALSFDCNKCGAHSEFVLEEFASGPALVRRYNEISGESVKSGEEVVSAAGRNNPGAIQVLTSGGEALGNLAGLLVNILDPEAIIVGGGLGLSGGHYWRHFESSTRRHIWYEGARDLPIRPAALGVDAGIIGATVARWQKQKLSS